MKYPLTCEVSLASFDAASTWDKGIGPMRGLGLGSGIIQKKVRLKAILAFVALFWQAGQT